jgi:hypothetical protein
MENDWDLQAVPIAARAHLPGTFHRYVCCFCYFWNCTFFVISLAYALARGFSGKLGMFLHLQCLMASEIADLQIL